MLGTTFEVDLQIAHDYENGFIWFSKNEEEKWKKYASKRSLDPTVDVRENKMRMQRVWLRPLGMSHPLQMPL